MDIPWRPDRCKIVTKSPSAPGAPNPHAGFDNRGVETEHAEANEAPAYERAATDRLNLIHRATPRLHRLYVRDWNACAGGHRIASVRFGRQHAKFPRSSCRKFHQIGNEKRAQSDWRRSKRRLHGPNFDCSRGVSTVKNLLISSRLQ